MKINIELDEEAFNKVITDGVNKLSEDDLKGIAVQAAKEYFENNKENVIEKLLFSNSGSYGWENHPDLTPFGRKLIDSLDYPQLQEIMDKCCKYFMKNYREIIEKMFLESFMNNLVYSSTFHQKITESVQKEVFEMEARLHNQQQY